MELESIIGVGSEIVLLLGTAAVGTYLVGNIITSLKRSPSRRKVISLYQNIDEEFGSMNGFVSQLQKGTEKAKDYMIEMWRTLGKVCVTDCNLRPRLREVQDFIFKYGGNYRSQAFFPDHSCNC